MATHQLIHSLQSRPWMLLILGLLPSHAARAQTSIQGETNTALIFTLFIAMVCAGWAWTNARKLTQERRRRISAEEKLAQAMTVKPLATAPHVDPLQDDDYWLKTAQKIAKIGTWELDLRDRSMKWSDEIFEIFGLDPCQDKASQKNFESRLHPADRDWVNRSFEKSVETHQSYEIVHRLKLPDGRVKHVQAMGKATYDKDGKPTKAIGTIQDVTRRWRAESNSRKAAAIYEATAQGVVVTDLYGNILSVNPAFCEISGYDEADLLGQNASIMVSDRHEKPFRRGVLAALHSDGTWRGQVWNKRKDASDFPALLTINAILNDEGEGSGYIGIFTDISAVQETESKLDFLMHHDPLTELPNRSLLKARLEHRITMADRHDVRLGVVLIDLDQFKDVNDSLGHAIGDRLLKELSKRLVKVARNEDTVARLGGDEFVILLEDVETDTQARTAVEKIMAAIARPFVFGEVHVSVTASAGISLFPQDGDGFSKLLSNADAAMYLAKEEGRNTYRFFASELTERAFEQVFMKNEICSGMTNGEFWLAYQPKIDFSNASIDGLEVLLRWSHPRQGEIPPSRFIPVAEHGGLIRTLGHWVLNEACRQGRQWLDQGYRFGRLAVNVTGLQIQHPSFYKEVVDALECSKLPPEYLELEVTESIMISRPEDAIQSLADLHELGIKIAIDDFGTGYSSLSYLKRLPIDRLKIDKSFVRALPEDKEDAAICETVIAMARALNLRVIAEGVESLEHAQFLKERGCDEGQGYLFSPGMAAGQIEDFLRAPDTLTQPLQRLH